MLKGLSISTRKRTDDKTVVSQTGFHTTRTSNSGLFSFVTYPSSHLRYLKMCDFSVKLLAFLLNIRCSSVACYVTYISLRKTKHGNCYKNTTIIIN